MGFTMTRRGALKLTAAGLLASCGVRSPRAFAEDAIETHGLSSFGDLALPADFKHFGYVNPDAPKGGLLSLQITNDRRQSELRHVRHAEHFFQEGRRRGGHVGDFRHPDERQRRRAGLGLRPRRAGRALFPGQADLSLPAAPGGALFRRLETDRRRRRILAEHPQGEGPSDLFAVAERGRKRQRRSGGRRAGALHQGAHAATRISSSSACRSSRRPGGRDATSTPRPWKRRSAPAPIGSRRSNRAVSSSSSSIPAIGARTCRSMSARTISNACASNIIASGRSPSKPSRPARSTSTRNTLRASGRTATTSPR